MKIRPAITADALAISKVHCASWQTTYKGIVSDSVLEKFIPENRAQGWIDIITNKPPYPLFVAEDDQEGIVGFCDGGPSRDKPAQFEGEIYAIYILENYQRQRIGRKLLVPVIESLLKHDLNSLHVWVLENNPHRNFYESLGGVNSGVKTLPIGGREYQIVSFGWPNLRSLYEKILN